jgi:uncharacterized protein (TIGR03435 family)
MNRFGLQFVLWIVATGCALAQVPAGVERPAFDVASVRPSKAGATQRSNVPLDSGNVYSTVSADDARTASGGYFVATHQPLWRYISFAYKLSGTQELSFRFNMFSGAPKSGAPFWVTGGFDSPPEFFDISARAPADTSIDQMRLMMQSLLAERFHLHMHTVEADAPVFALVLEKDGITGPKLQPHPASDVCSADAAAHTAASAVGDLPPVCGVIAHVASTTPGQHYGGRGVSLSLFANSVQTMTGIAAVPRPVVDETGLTGLYDFHLTWVHDSANGDAGVVDNSASFRDALKQQLGLKLKNARAPIRFLIVDRVEKPSEN